VGAGEGERVLGLAGGFNGGVALGAEGWAIKLFAAEEAGVGGVGGVGVEGIQVAGDAGDPAVLQGEGGGEFHGGRWQGRDGMGESRFGGVAVEALVGGNGRRGGGDKRGSDGGGVGGVGFDSGVGGTGGVEGEGDGEKG